MTDLKENTSCCCGQCEGDGVNDPAKILEDAEADENQECSCGDDCSVGACMPAPSFSTFVLSLASTALVQLGEVPDPSSGKQETDLVMAKHTIDILSMLQDKILNGLDEEENRILEGLLYELRMKFVLKK